MILEFIVFSDNKGGVFWVKSLFVNYKYLLFDCWSNMYSMVFIFVNLLKLFIINCLECKS